MSLLIRLLYIPQCWSWALVLCIGYGLTLRVLWASSTSCTSILTLYNVVCARINNQSFRGKWLKFLQLAFGSVWSLWLKSNIYVVGKVWNTIFREVFAETKFYCILEVEWESLGLRKIAFQLGFNKSLHCLFNQIYYYPS